MKLGGELGGLKCVKVRVSGRIGLCVGILLYFCNVNFLIGGEDGDVWLEHGKKIN